MIVVSKDNEDRVIAYMEARVVGQSGFDVLNGEYLYIADLWIHKDYKNDWSVFRELMNATLFKAISIRWVYFNRTKYHNRMSKNYSRERIINMLNRVPMMLMKEVA